MPYQAGWPPDYNYNYQGRRAQNQYQSPQAHVNQTPQLSAPQPLAGGDYSRQLPPGAYLSQSAGSAGHPHAIYSVPQFHPQSQYPAFYQTAPQYPSPQQQHFTQYQRPASMQPTSITDPSRFSPDPLHAYQPAPVPQRKASNQTLRQSHGQSHPPLQAPVERATSRTGLQWTDSTPPQNHAPSVQSNAMHGVERSQPPPQTSQLSRPRVPKQVGTPSRIVSSTPRSHQERLETQPKPGHSVQRPRQSSSTQQFPAKPLPDTVNPQEIQYRAVQVQLPLQRPVPTEQGPDMVRPPKRRRSNESQAVPVCHAPSTPQRPASSGRNQPKAPPGSPPIESGPSQSLTASKPAAPIDYQAVLLGLSDEYINSAYNMTAAIASGEVRDDDLEQYHALISMGMGCLESSLQNYRIPDQRKEARIRLRLATLLHEETLNTVQAEEVLSKGISVCERARLGDLKYAMHHLLARVWVKGGKLRAAINVVEKLVMEVQKLKLVHWTYTFRFLRINLGLQVSASHSETTAMVKHLTAIADLAQSLQHVGVQMIACVLEALVQLRSRSPESTDLAQRALASVRMHQLSPELKSLPHVRTLLDCIDLACDLQRGSHEQAKLKMRTMQATMESATREVIWQKDGSWTVPIPRITVSSPDIGADTGGIMETTSNGECALRFIWLTKTQVLSLGYLLSGITGMQSTGIRAQKFLAEGLQNTKIMPDATLQSLSTALELQDSLMMMRVVLRAYGVFAYCGTFEWEKALRGIATLRQNVAHFGLVLDAELNVLVLYLEALCKHGLGDLKGAIRLYSLRELQIDWKAAAKPSSGNVDPIKVLAAIHCIAIKRHLNDSSGDSVELGNDEDDDLQRLRPLCLTAGNSSGSRSGSKALEAAYYTLEATKAQSSGNGQIVKTKQCLESGVQAAQKAGINHLTAILLSCMTDKFFTNIVGLQAEKSAATACHLAKKSQDKLWTAVAGDMYGATLEKCGKDEEAKMVRDEAENAFEVLPQPLKDALARDQMHMS